MKRGKQEFERKVEVNEHRKKREIYISRLPLVEFAVNNILRLIGRGSCREIEEMRQELFGHVVKQLVCNTQSFA